MTLRGMTWSHPRATEPLAAFEAHPISELAREYDVLVIDQPGIGAAVGADALRPGGPHAGLLLLAVASSADSIDALIEPGFGRQAFSLLTSSWPVVDQAVSLRDPIAVQEAIAAPRGPVYCPLAYGDPGCAPAVAWSDAPAWQSGPPGTVPGGTGLAVSAPTRADPDQVRQYISGYLDPEVQNDPVPPAGGQSAAIAAWTGPEVDRTAGGYFSSTPASVVAGWIRPRSPGWIQLQEQVSAIVRETVTEAGDPADAIARINTMYVAQEVRT